MTLRRTILLLLTIDIAAVLTGCGGGLPAISIPSAPISVLFLGNPPTSMAINASTILMVGVIHNSSNDPVSWSVTCGSPGACGHFSSSVLLSSSPVTYTAPAAIPTGTTVTLTATSQADTTKSISATVTITPPIPISVTFYVPPPAAMQVNSTAPIRAAIANDVSADPEVEWSANCSTSQCGSFNPTATTSEAASNFTAPPTVPPGDTVTVTATSMTDPTKSVSTTIVITRAAPTLANGTYVFQLSGSVGSSASFITGVLVANNGSITGGEQDVANFTTDSNDDLVPFNQFSKITGGSYATTPDGNLQISINVAQYGTETLNGALVSPARGFVADLYGSVGNGTLVVQTAAAAPSGGYAVSLYGGDKYGQTARIGGVLNVDSPGRISGAGSVLDVVDPGVYLSGTDSLAASTVSAPDAFGRVTVQLLSGGTSLLPSLYLAGYIVDSTHIQLVETAGDNYLGALGGMALGQGSSTGQFTIGSVTGSSYVFGVTGVDKYGTLQVAGICSFNTGGAIGGTLNWNDQSGKTAQSPIPFTGSWTVDPTGRVTLTNLTDGATFNYSAHLYLTGNGGGLLLSDDISETGSGQAYQQQTGTLTTTSFSGSYGISASQTGNSYTAQSPIVIGSVTATPGTNTDTIAGFADSANGGSDYVINGSFTTTAANGVLSGTMTGLGSASRTTPGNFTLYLVDSTRAIVIETDSAELTLGYLQLQQ